jgi:hypothetical protein
VLRLPASILLINVISVGTLLNLSVRVTARARSYPTFGTPIA